ncbi:alkaline phosphatase family protein [Xenorhabdus innexi]|uniref:Phospholipase n=1 Tax=Xenorhabdus innexi TaxID=290109 RepID=A0A1N6MZJ0_9GAMM|nr:alkaline phosphatase family protein [Xenorhabdus innexi]PHM30484.1 putative phospholipase [Xenorhabdus innexi]SIP74227.1 putative Phospholipase C [Xenorhabdus innexi]
MSLTYEFLVQWTPSNGDWNLYQFVESDVTPEFNLVKTGNWQTIKSGHQLIPIGNYVIDRDTASNQFRLWQVDIAQSNFLPSLIIEGDLSTELSSETEIIPLGNYLLLYRPDTGTYKCRRFDPFSSTLMLTADSPQNITGQWQTITNADLIPVAGYVVSRNRSNGQCRTWMFDGGNAADILPNPQIPGMQWTIDPNIKLCVLGDKIVGWSPDSRDITLWPVDPTLACPALPSKTITVWNGALPADTILFGVSPLIPLELPKGVQGEAEGPGTIRWMRQRIKKVVYLMLENRSLDHIFGDIYTGGKVGKFIGSDKPFDGASNTNWNADHNGHRYYQTKFSVHSVDYPKGDPDHSYSGIIQQLFDGADSNAGRIPEMKGFVKSYGSRGKSPDEVMNYYDPDMLEPLSMLAKQFAVSDAWFCSLPGPTDPNRAFSLTGSSFSKTENFESGEIYIKWPYSPHRPSVWDVLWAHGIKDWKLYYHTTWGNLRYTNHLFLKGHIQEVDQASDNYNTDISEFISSAKAGTLPIFSFIEPAWLGNSSGMVPNSCHPPSDMAPGLKMVADIYNALRQGPDFDQTLLIITFDEHGGIYDHVPPPYTNNAYRNDKDGDFGFDLLGVRIPTVLISPWIENGTVFRSTQEGSQYDATSFLSTLLQWQGIPASNWWLGDRIRAAASFESVFQAEDLRKDIPLNVPTPELDPEQLDMPMNELHRLFVTRIVYTLCAETLSSEEAEQEAQNICALGSIRLATNALNNLEVRLNAIHSAN